MNQEETFSAEQSMATITGMIQAAKNKLADDGFLLIFWGWLVTVAALINYISIHMQFEKGYLVWPVLMPLGGIVSAVYGYKQGKKKTVKTHIDSYLSFIWGSFLISMFIALGFMPFHGIKSTYFILMILYGIATFTTGGILGFKPLIFGSLVSFACAIISVFLSEPDQLLIIAIALIFSYIIPGHLLRNKFKSQHV
ncbi:MAG: hypothetical protein IPM51_16260 [Sphingobacteriaceae bacterium]|nr:hypothetical protein [Sphingobacteriaceae bacterium]